MGAANDQAVTSGLRYRNPLKNALTSSTSNCGCSMAAKCPPRGIAVQRVMLKRGSSQRRGDQMISLGKSAQAVGVSMRRGAGGATECRCS
jgi:hypothetical protein